MKTPKIVTTSPNEDRMHAGAFASPSIALRLERTLGRIVLGGLALVGLLCLLGVFLFTLGFDEAWILRGIQGILSRPEAAFAINPVGTSGGVYALFQTLISAIAGPAVWPQRLFVLACLVGVLGIVARWGRTNDSHGSARANARLIALAVFAGVPGLVVLGSTAYAAVPAVLLCFLAIQLFWTLDATGVRKGDDTSQARTPGPLSRHRRWLVVGTLGGLAGATRFNCALVLPAILAACVLSDPRERRRDLIDALLACVLGAGVFFATVHLYTSFGDNPLAAATISNSTGLTAVNVINYPRYMNQLLTAHRLAPIPMLALFVAGGLWLANQPIGRPLRQMVHTLIVFGVSGWLAWITLADITHLRYGFPALSAFYAVAGLVVARLYVSGAEHNEPFLRVLALAVAAAFVFANGAVSFRHLVHGNADIVSWEWAGESRTTYFTRFRAPGYQRAAASYLRESTAPDEAVLALGLDMAIGYLAERPVLIGRWLRKRGEWVPERLPKRFFLSHFSGNYEFPTEATRRFIRENAELEAQFGPYSFYRLTGSYPVDPEPDFFVLKRYEGNPLSKPFQ